MYIGWPVFRSSRRAVRSGCGQVSGEPSGLADQSCARMSAPISPPPFRNTRVSTGCRATLCIGIAPVVRGRTSGFLALQTPQSRPRVLARPGMAPPDHLLIHNPREQLGGGNVTVILGCHGEMIG